MCDYSLHAFRNRLAVDGEDLVVHRFLGASLGLASPADLRAMATDARSGSDQNRLWGRIVSWLQAQKPKWELERQICAICVPPGARLILRDIPKGLQKELKVAEVEAVTFVEVSAEANSYRDAVRFSNGREVLLQTLREGQRVIVLALAPEQTGESIFEEDPGQAVSEPSLVR
jgi:hypothetical protein